MKEYYNMHKSCAANMLAYDILNYLPECERFAVICIGTDRCVADSLGPLVGTLLGQKTIPVSIGRLYGTLDIPVHAKNLDEALSRVKDDMPIIAIDSSIGDKIDYIRVSKGGITPGIGVGNKCTEIGNVSLTGILLTKNDIALDRDSVYHVRLSKIYKMADIISDAILKVAYEKEKKT